MTDKEIIESVLFFNAAFYIVLAVVLYSILHSAFLWFYRWRSEDLAEIQRLKSECLVLREILENVTIESERLEELKSVDCCKLKKSEIIA